MDLSIKISNVGYPTVSKSTAFAECETRGKPLLGVFVFANFSLNSIFKSKLLAGFAAFALAVSGMVAISATSAQAIGCDESFSSGQETLLKQALELRTAETICVSGTFTFTSAIFPATRDSLTIKGYPSATFNSGSGLTSNTLLVTTAGEAGPGIENLTVENIVFDGGEGNGRAISAQNVTVINSSFKAFSIDDNGGAIYATGDVSVINSYFENNTADGAGGSYGGAIYAEGELSVRNSDFVMNEITTTGSGGALFSEKNISVSDSEFIENTVSQGYGGAIAVDEDQEAIIRNSTFTSNTVSEGGGAISGNNGAKVFIYDSNFEDNSSDDVGGAIAVQDGVLEIYGDSNFIQNEAPFGGAISTYGSILEIDGANFENNKALGYDDGSGGAINAENFVTIYNSTFEGNEAEFEGGAIYASSGEIFLSTFSNNSAVNGGAIYAENGLLAENSTFENNTSENIGGAIYASSGEIFLSTFSNNSAENGGAVFIDSSGFLSVENSTFYLNSAMNEGGAIYASSGEAYFSTFLNNEATSSGVDVPGNSIYKVCGVFELGANIFAGQDDDYELGFGEGGICQTQFTDLGGNVFTTRNEIDLESQNIADDIFTASVFDSEEKQINIINLFGEFPSLNQNENVSGPMTVALILNSPAIDAAELVVGADYFIETDQRGFTRIGIPDTGAYEFGASESENGDGSKQNSGPSSPTANAYAEKDLGSVYFAPGSSRLSNSAKKQIQALIAANPNSLYKVTGYVQKARTSKNDQRLSEARARTVEQYLVTLGAGTNFTVVIEAGKIPAKDGTKSTARRATLYLLTPVVR